MSQRDTYADANDGIVSPRKAGSPKRGYITWQLSVPQSLVRSIPNLGNLRFKPEVTSEGILYRPVAKVVFEDIGEWHVSNGDGAT